MILLRMIAFRPAVLVDEPAAANVPVVADDHVALGGDASRKKCDELAGRGEPAPERQPLSVAEPAPEHPEPVNMPLPAADSESSQSIAPESVAPEVPPIVELQPARDAESPAIVGDKPALIDLRPEQWPQLLDELGIGGIVYNIASHCELRSVLNDALVFVLDADNGSLFNASHSGKIRQALENYFGCQLSVEITVGALEGETPAMRQARLAHDRQLEAVAAIEQDEKLQQLIARFDGELDHSSIIPLDH